MGRMELQYHLSWSHQDDTLGGCLCVFPTIYRNICEGYKMLIMSNKSSLQEITSLGSCTKIYQPHRLKWKHKQTNDVPSCHLRSVTSSIYLPRYWQSSVAICSSTKLAPWNNQLWTLSHTRTHWNRSLQARATRLIKNPTGVPCVLLEGGKFRSSIHQFTRLHRYGASWFNTGRNPR